MLPPTTTITSTEILTMMHSSTTATTATTANPSSKPLLVDTNTETNTATVASTSSTTWDPSPPLSTPSSTPTTVRILVEASLSSSNNATSHLDRSTIAHDHHNSTGYPLSNAVTPPSLRPCRIFSRKPVIEQLPDKVKHPHVQNGR